MTSTARSPPPRLAAPPSSRPSCRLDGGGGGTTSPLRRFSIPLPRVVNRTAASPPPPPWLPEPSSGRLQCLRVLEVGGRALPSSGTYCALSCRSLCGRRRVRASGWLLLPAPEPTLRHATVAAACSSLVVGASPPVGAVLQLMSPRSHGRGWTAGTPAGACVATRKSTEPRTSRYACVTAPCPPWKTQGLRSAAARTRLCPRAQ